MKTSELAATLGISVQMCNRLKKRGMPSDSLQNAIEWRKKNLDVTQTKGWRIDGNHGLKPVSIEPTEDSRTFEELQAVVSNAQLNLDGNDADELFKNARALKEKAFALQAAAEHEKFVGALVEKEVVEKIIFERGRQFRDGLLGLSRRLAPALAEETNISVIEGRLTQEFRQLLEQFAKLPIIE